MNIIKLASTGFLGLGLAIIGGAAVFSGALTALGYVAYISLFIGALGTVGFTVVACIPEKKEGKAEVVSPAKA